MGGVQPLQNFQAGFAGHVDIQDGQIGLMLDQQFQCAGTIIAGGKDMDTQLFPVDDLLQAVHNDGLIIGQDQIPHGRVPP